MRWRFWRPEPSAAERSLAELQGSAATAESPPPPGPPAGDPMTGFAAIPGLEHLAAATDMSFGLKVDGVASDGAGRTVLTSPRSEGAVAPGDLVGLLLLAAPHNEPGALDGDPQRAAAVAAEISLALAHARATSATVVSWQPATVGSAASLTVVGVPPGDVPPGTLVMR